MRKLIPCILILMLWFGCDDSLINPISDTPQKTIEDISHAPVDWISFSPDGEYMISASPEDENFWSNIIVRNVSNSNFDTTIKYQIPDSVITRQFTVVSSGILTENFNTTEKYFIVGRKNGVNLYEFRTTGGAKLFRSISIPGDVTQLALYNDSLLVCGNNIGAIKIWDLKNDRLVRSITAHAGAISGILITQNGKTIITSSFDNSLTIWRVSDGKALHTMYHDNSVTGISISPDEKYLVSVGLDKNIHLWNPISGDWYRTIKDNDWINAVAFSPDKSTIATGGDDNIVKLWDVSTGKKITAINNHSGRILALAYSKDGKYLASSASDKKIIITEMK